MRGYRLFFVLAGTLFAAAFVAPTQDPLNAVYERIDAAALKFRALTANLRRVNHEEVIHEEEVESGTIKVKRSKPKELMVRLDIEGPNAKQAVVNGNKVEVYDPNQPGVIEELPLGGKRKALMDDYMALGFGASSSDLRTSYTVKYGGPETVAGEATTRLELTPKTPGGLDLKRIDLWISDKGGYVVQQKLYQPAKNYTLFTYTNINLNAVIPDSVFHLDVPKGTKRETLIKKK